MKSVSGELPSGAELRDDAEAPALVSNGRVLLIGAVCAVFVALSVSAQSYLSMLGHGHSFWRILWWQLSTAGLWALFAPVLVRVGARLHDLSSVQRRTWALVAAAGLLAIAAHIAITAQLSIWLSPFQPVVVSDFAFAVRSQFESQFATDVLVFAMLLVVGRTAAVSDRARRSALRESKLEAELARAHLEALRLVGVAHVDGRGRTWRGERLGEFAAAPRCAQLDPETTGLAHAHARDAGVVGLGELGPRDRVVGRRQLAALVHHGERRIGAE